jgi:hypothetical protein
MTILLYGEKRVGKDTVADIIEKFININRFAFAKKPKEIFCKIKNISLEYFENNKEKYRSEFNWFAEEMKKGYPYIWVDFVKKQMNVTEINLITDLRFNVEYEKIKEIDNIKVIHIIDKNIKEENIDKIKFNEEIILDNTEKDINKLQNKVKDILIKIGVLND